MGGHRSTHAHAPPSAHNRPTLGALRARSPKFRSQFFVIDDDRQAARIAVRLQRLYFGPCLFSSLLGPGLSRHLMNFDHHRATAFVQYVDGSVCSALRASTWPVLTSHAIKRS